MSGRTVWFITGAGSGMGTAFTQTALGDGNAVVATDRNPDAVTKAVGAADDLLVVKLDVTSPDDAEAAASAAVERFGRIDVLVNNAGSSFKGYFDLKPDLASGGGGEPDSFQADGFTRCGIRTPRG